MTPDFGKNDYKVDPAIEKAIKQQYINKFGETPEAAPAVGGEPVQAKGALRTSLVVIRPEPNVAEAKGNAASVRAAFSEAGHVLAGILRSTAKAGATVAGVVLFPVTISLAALASKYHSSVSAPRADEAFRKENDKMVKNLEVIQPGTLAANDAIMEKLAKHAQSMGNTITPQELKQYVAAGEKIANQLGEAGTHRVKDHDKVFIKSLEVEGYEGGGHIEVKSSLYTTRALSWMMMAKAAEMDIKQHEAGVEAPGNMVTSGSFVMKDQGNKIFNFLSAAPTAGDRISTHFNERVGHDRTGFMGAKPIQRGIEDYSNKLPGQKGTMLFDKLIDKRDPGDRSKIREELFVKFESVGCPPVFHTGSDLKGQGGGVVQAFSAIYRNLGHAVSFLSGQKASTENTVLRQEHAYKGMLKKDVMEPFEALVKQFNSAGVTEGDSEISLSAMRAGAKSHGLPFVLDILQQFAEIEPDVELHTVAVSDHVENLRDLAKDLIASINEKTAPLDSISGAYGIERRGAEVHLSMGSKT